MVSDRIRQSTSLSTRDCCIVLVDCANETSVESDATSKRNPRCLLVLDLSWGSHVPYISIRPVDREIKAAASNRDIPLVGVALDAMRQAPGGFPHYRDKGELVSANLMKAFRQRELFPTADHVIYSFRNAFEDRMLEAGIDHDMRYYFMGYKNQRPSYGEKGSMEFRRDLLMKIVHPYPEGIVASI